MPWRDKDKSLTTRLLYFAIDTTTTKVIETLFAVNFLLQAITALLPETLIYSSLNGYLDRFGPHYRYVAAFVYTVIAVGMIYALYKRVVWLRQALLLASSSICVLYACILLFANARAGSSAGFLLILAALAVMGAWKSNTEG